MCMSMIENYNQLPISQLQQTRLYLQGRPLLHLWSRKRKGCAVPANPVIEAIDRELDSDYIALDCAGWYFANDQRTCTAIELYDLSQQYWSQVHFEHDYLTWHPTYLPDQPVLAYFSTYFKYCELADFLQFCRTWLPHHPKLIIGLDPTKIKYNYFRFRLLDILKEHLPGCEIQVLDQQDFHLLFTLTQT